MTEQMFLSLSNAPTLAQVLIDGQGTERPFRCPDPNHMDTHASASVNVIKGVWFCYGCGAKGKVDSKAAPSALDLMAMSQPEQACRVYPESWLAWFGAGYYWADRFPLWVCRMMSLGQDPMNLRATFPVRTAQGKLAGVGQRNDSSEARYLYPAHWAASRSLHGFDTARTLGADLSVITLVEGAADATAGWEVAMPTFGCYGAGIHQPQIELLAQISPKLVLLGFDADEAGVKATDRTIEALQNNYETATIDWSTVGAKDPADTSCEGRLEAISEAVASSRYGRNSDAMTTWTAAAHTYEQRYDKDV